MRSRPTTTSRCPKVPKSRSRPDPGMKWHAFLPTCARSGTPFRLTFKVDDKWGNPSDLVDRTVRLVPEGAIEGLPPTVPIKKGQFGSVIDGLQVAGPGEVSIRVLDESGARTVPLQPAARHAQGRRSHPFLGRYARPVERDTGHQYGAGIFRVRPGQGAPRRHGPPGQ